MGCRIWANPFAVLCGIAVEHVFFQKERLAEEFFGAAFSVEEIQALQVHDGGHEPLEHAAQEVEGEPVVDELPVRSDAVQADVKDQHDLLQAAKRWKGKAQRNEKLA